MTKDLDLPHKIYRTYLRSESQSEPIAAFSKGLDAEHFVEEYVKNEIENYIYFHINTLDNTIRIYNPPHIDKAFDNG